MKAFACAYRHFQQSNANKRRSREEAAGNELALRFIEAYDRSDNFFDW